ncbi:glutathione S-transferase [Thozetella sp. PMI_491]|nr:glutathione S-transferase [Thozetella sp. PMI_491]
MRGHPRIRKIFAIAALASVELASPEPDLEPDVTNRTPEYRAKFPLGKIPAFESSDGSFRLVESEAIAAYVAGCAKDPKIRLALLGGTLEERALVQQWTSFTGHHFEPTVLKIAEFVYGPPEARGSSEEKSQMQDWDRWLTYLENHLRGDGSGGTPRKWLVSIGGGAEDCPSIADITVACVLWGGCRVFMDPESRARWPESIRWLQQIRTTPGIHESFAGLMLDEKE